MNTKESQSTIPLYVYVVSFSSAGKCGNQVLANPVEVCLSGLSPAIIKM